MKCFGCIEGDIPLGFPSAEQNGAVNKDELVAPYLQAMAKFRADIRNAMRQSDKENLNKTVSQHNSHDQPPYKISTKLYQTIICIAF